jgi:hypothetical protein
MQASTLWGLVYVVCEAGVVGVQWGMALNQFGQFTLSGIAAAALHAHLH